MSIRETAGGGVMALAGLGASMLGLIIHVWTVVIAFSVAGMFAAVLTLIFPVLSQVFWFFKVGANMGFGTMYCVAIMAYIGCFVIVFLGAAMLAPRT